MARDKTARKRDENELSVDRRSFLGATGAGVVSALGVGALATGAASAADYQTITVSAGSKRTFNVGSGETFENVLIDMTASGASAQIIATGDDWTVRNVAFKGNHPGGHYLFTPAVSEGGTATVENLYMGDGQTEGSGKGGIWVIGRDHYGTLNFRNIYLAQFIDNGLYGTDPGYSYHGSHGGVVNVYDSYFDSNNISNIRVGSIDGRTCHVENCVVVDGNTRGCGVGCTSSGAKVPRGVWAWWGPVEVRDSDIGSSPAQRVQSSRAGNPEIISENTRWGSDANTDRVPSGVPMTAEEAASGTSSASSGSGSTPTNDPQETEEESSNDSGTVLELVAGSNASNVGYEFTVEGSVSKRTSAGEKSAESNDTITDNGDGTTTVSGVSGMGMGDSFLVDGSVTSMTLDESKWTIRFGGQEVSVAELTGSQDDSQGGETELPNVLIIDGSDTPNAVSEYTFTVSGEAQKTAKFGSINGYDTVSEGEISGRIIGGKDAYRFSGDITGFSLSGPADVTVQENS